MTRTLYIRHVPDDVAERLERLGQSRRVAVEHLRLAGAQRNSPPCRQCRAASGAALGGSRVRRDPPRPCAGAALNTDGGAGCLGSCGCAVARWRSTRAALAEANLQAPELIDAELLSVLRRLVLAETPCPSSTPCKLWLPASSLGLRRHSQSPSLAAGLGAAHQPQRLRRDLRGPGRTAGRHPAHRRRPCSPGSRPALPRGGADPMSVHLSNPP